jgi:CBS domain-containing protein
VAELFDLAAHHRRFSSYPVVDDGRFVGVVSLREAGTVPPEERARRRVREVMTPAEQVPKVEPDRTVTDVLQASGGAPRRGDRGRQGGGRAVSLRHH